MIKNNIFFVASVSNAAAILITVYLCDDEIIASRYLEFLLLVQTITFCDLGLVAFAQKFGARVISGVSYFEHYGSQKRIERPETICRNILIKFFSILLCTFILSSIFVFLVVFLLKFFCFYYGFSNLVFIYCVFIGITIQAGFILSNALLGFQYIFTAKALEIMQNGLRIFCVIFFASVVNTPSFTNVLSIYFWTSLLYLLLLCCALAFCIYRLTFDDRPSKVNIRSSVLPFLLRNWVMSFFGFLFFNVAAIFSTTLPDSPQKTFFLLATRVFNFARIYSQSEFLSFMPRMVTLNMLQDRFVLLDMFRKSLRRVIIRLFLSLTSICLALYLYAKITSFEVYFSIIFLMVLIYFHETIQSCFAQLVLTSNYVPFVIPPIYSSILAYSLLFAFEPKSLTYVLAVQYVIFLSCIGWYSIYLANKRYRFFY